MNINISRFTLSRMLKISWFVVLLSAGTVFAQSATPAAPVQTGPTASIEPAPEALAARYPAGSIQSMDMANQALQEVTQQRNALDQKYAAEQHDCYQKFFATSCLDAAKERHRVGSAQIRKVEVEANAFVRSDRVVQRDKNLAEKRANDAANPPKPLAELPKQVPQNPVDKAKEHQQHIADHDAKEQQRKQEEINEAPQRAANVAAYNKKVQDAVARQNDVAKKKEEKAKQAAAKAAASSKTSDSGTSKVGVVPAASATEPTSSAPALAPKP